MRRRSVRDGAVLTLLAALTSTGAADSAGQALRNAFNDPFFRISAAIVDCPLPAGPFIDATEQRVQAHHRAERGTTCWLTGQCDRPNAYAYDEAIAAALQAALRERHPFADTSVWVTVQGRIVYLEGCVARASEAAELEAFARAIPDVQQAIAIVRDDPRAPPPYRLRDAR